MIRTIVRTYRSAYSGLPRDVWLLSTMLLVNRAGSMVLPFLSLYLTRVRGLSLSDAGRLLSVYGLGAIAGAYVGGWLSDRIGATRAQQLSLATSGAAYLWVSEVESPWALAFAMFVLSVLVESFRPAVMADVAERAPDRLQLRAFALLRLAANLGVGIGPAVGGYLALVGYRWLFVADALTCWVAGAMLVLLLRPVSGERERRDAAPGASPWRDAPFLLLMLFVVVLTTAFFQVWTTLPVYYREHYAFREDTIGLLLALNPALIVLFEMVLVRWAESRRLLPLIGLGAFLVCAGMALMPLGRSVAFVSLTISIWTLGEMLALPLLNSVVADRAAPSARGRYMGAYMMAFSVAFALAPAIGMYVYETLGPTALWLGIGGIGVPLWIWSVGMMRVLRPHGPRNP